jgi:hydrogenase maturation protein HypF
MELFRHHLGLNTRAMDSLMIHRDTMPVRGLVQGLGFRPFIDRLASYFGLGDSARTLNAIELQAKGQGVLLDRVVDRLAVPNHERLRHPDQEAPRLEGDLGTCVDCLVELFDPLDRRSRDSFIACGSCGPRWTLGDPSPANRTPACPKCRAEFEDSASRRFQDEGITCPECGPRLRIEGFETSGLSPIEATVAALLEGKIGALKGTGGYHLACDASSPAAVTLLRRRKRFDERPMPVMVANLSAARTLCEISDDEAALLTSPRRPIVILKKRSGPSILADEVAGKSPWIEVMLPYTAMHYLILHELRGVPLVMTGGQSSGEPIAFDNVAARKWLKTVADFFLVHDRPILVRSDDSVTRIAAGVETIVRRSRGYVPEPVALPRECPVPILAVGSQQQSAFSLGQGSQAVLSHHLSDLRNLEAFRAFEKAIDHYEARLGVTPELVVHDFDPDDASTFHAIRRGVETLPVQHHHAHVASCMAENGLDETVIGVVLDGNGLGGDGSFWGGEFLVANYDGFRRAGQFRNVPMPGGSAAILQPWRMALAHLGDARISGDLIGVSQAEQQEVEAILKRRIDAPTTSSVARLFDAVAVLAGLRRDLSHEGQIADELEWRSTESEADHAYPFGLTTAEDRPRLVIDTRPMIAAIARDVRRGVDTARIGRRFHSSMVEAIAGVCVWIRARDGLNVVALSGSVFQNKLLLEETITRLDRDGFEVHHHRQVPTHDGGLSLGQLAIAAAWSSRNREKVFATESQAIA